MIQEFPFPKTLKEFIEELDDTFSDYYEYNVKDEEVDTDTRYNSKNIKYYTSEGKPVYED